MSEFLKQYEKDYNFLTAARGMMENLHLNNKMISFKASYDEIIKQLFMDTSAYKTGKEIYEKVKNDIIINYVRHVNYFYFISPFNREEKFNVPDYYCIKCKDEAEIYFNKIESKEREELINIWKSIEREKIYQLNLYKILVTCEPLIKRSRLKNGYINDMKKSIKNLEKLKKFELVSLPERIEGVKLNMKDVRETFNIIFNNSFTSFEDTINEIKKIKAWEKCI